MTSNFKTSPRPVNDPSRRVLYYLRTVGGRARVDRVMEATGLDRETILRGAGRPTAKVSPKRKAEPVREADDWLTIDWI